MKREEKGRGREGRNTKVARCGVEGVGELPRLAGKGNKGQSRNVCGARERERGNGFGRVLEGGKEGVQGVGTAEANVAIWVERE